MTDLEMNYFYDKIYKALEENNWKEALITWRHVYMLTTVSMPTRATEDYQRCKERIQWYFHQLFEQWKEKGFS